jgi:CRISPR/Cas system-associated exonuclease Cas4 (RecB family)
MKLDEMTQLDRVEAKIDFLFGISSNETMANEFMQAYQAETQKKEPNEEIVKKAEEMFNYHIKNVRDSITYYVELFGKESNQRIVSLVQDNIDFSENQEPDAVSEVETTSNHTSEKVE